MLSCGHALTRRGPRECFGEGIASWFSLQIAIEWQVALAQVLEKPKDGGTLPVHVGRVVFDTAFVKDQTRVLVGGSGSHMSEAQILGPDLFEKDIRAQMVSAIAGPIDRLVHDVPAVDSTVISRDHVGHAPQHRRARRLAVRQFPKPFRRRPIPEQTMTAE